MKKKEIDLKLANFLIYFMSFFAVVCLIMSVYYLYLGDKREIYSLSSSFIICVLLIILLKRDKAEI